MYDRICRCDICGKDFRAKWNLKDHKEKAHEGLNRFLCDAKVKPKCKKSFASKSSMEQHKDRDHKDHPSEYTETRLDRILTVTIAF